MRYKLKHVWENPDGTLGIYIEDHAGDLYRIDSARYQKFQRCIGGWGNAVPIEKLNEKEAKE